ncbi:MAG TPA: Trp biosynthesis-associated membrane protein [Streptosporangiaceae bacterium]|jgi:uncharacterized membrane protein (TIGR02234 family)
MTSETTVPGGRARRLPALRAMTPRQELAAVLVLGAAGAGLVLLAMRQGWAQVRTAAPAPLPDSVVTASGQSMIPYAEALAITALAALAAVLATRGLARRAVGVLLAGLGAGLGAGVAAGVTRSAALAAAAGTLGPATGSGAGNSAGSVTAGSLAGSQAAVPDVAGFHSHVVLTAASWQALAIVGALVIIAVGVLVAWRGPLLPVMSSRYDAPGGSPAPARPAAAKRAADGQAAGERAAASSAAVQTETARSSAARSSAAQPGTAQPGAAGSGATPAGATQPPRWLDSASMWESLSHGEDPTS